MDSDCKGQMYKEMHVLDVMAREKSLCFLLCVLGQNVYISHLDTDEILMPLEQNNFLHGIQSVYLKRKI